MTRIDKAIDLSGGRPSSSSFWTAFGLLIAGFFIGQFVSAMFVYGFMFANGATMEDIADPSAMFDYVSLSQLLLSQAFYTLVFTFLTPWFYLKYIAKKGVKDLYQQYKTPLLPAILTVLATVAFMFVNVYLVEWNAGIDLPESMDAFERLVKSIEESLAETTEKFTTFNSFGSFLMGFIVIAVLPGIGEEIMFRGVLQNTLHKYSGNKHIAIWVTGFIFAAIHLQFYGVVPRMMLGVLFGYLYVWSGNLWLPIISHITNNGLAVILTYASQLEATDLDIDDTESMPDWVSAIGLVICLGLLFLLRNYYLRSKSKNEV
ncbi:MAG: CPBP family intramembrane metalloprotease [Roseivirga sp.]|nr:CPBP family intramembrane metalloprotease [Roseivirga sp.]